MSDEFEVDTGDDSPLVCDDCTVGLKVGSIVYDSVPGTWGPVEVTFCSDECRTAFWARIGGKPE